MKKKYLKKKHLIKSRKKQIINKSLKNELKTLTKKFFKNLSNVNIVETDLIKEKNYLTKKIDKAVSKNLFHKNKGSNIKSKIDLALNKYKNKDNK
ncbi:30S ribosomal protein S20 [symbiont of Argiope bruennichi]|uniref:30S ribosomal protein S20 n=1 Tax=symbiont of Argiope bruennichi TaxID=2810479 RepID=UPI003DA6C98E